MPIRPSHRRLSCCSSWFLDSISQDYSSLQLDAEQIQKSIGDPNNLALLKDVMTKLG